MLSAFNGRGPKTAISRRRCEKLFAAELTVAFAFVLAVASGPVAWAGDLSRESCARFFRPFGEKFQGYFVSGFRTKETWPEGKPFFSQLFEAPNSVYLNIEEPHHYSIRIGDSTFHGEVMGMPKVEDGLKSDEAPQGLIIRIDNLTDETVRRMREAAELSQNYLSYSCVHYACSQLEKAGISVRELKERGESPIYLSNTLAAILRQGFTGTKGEPVETTLILNGKATINDISQRFKNYDTRLERLSEKRFRKKGEVDLAALGAVDPEVLALILKNAEKKGIKVGDTAATAASGAALILVLPRMVDFPSDSVPSLSPAAGGAQ